MTRPAGGSFVVPGDIRMNVDVCVCLLSDVASHLSEGSRQHLGRPGGVMPEESVYLEPVEALIIGQKYKARTTGTNRGVRVYYDVSFIAARASVEQFIRGTAVDQDRVFIVDPLGHGVIPALYVTGSIVEVADAQRMPWPASQLAGVAEPGCYHPRSCERCGRAGVPCGRHHVGDVGHERCVGQGHLSKGEVHGR